MITQDNISKITCAADANVVDALNNALSDLHIPEVYVQRAKQVTLVDKPGFFGIHARTLEEENRAMFYRFYVPKQFEGSIMRRIAEAADLYLPGRGSVYAKDVTLLRNSPLEFDEKHLTELKSNIEPIAEQHVVLICIVQRGIASSIASTILEMGLCVPLISFASGTGIRDRLGLLRITISVDKEVMYLLAPRADAELLEGVIVHKARIDQPGQGFLYRTNIRALAVNLRVRRGKRTDAATMDQVIAAMDQMQGSSEWRRIGRNRAKESMKDPAAQLNCLSVITDEGALGPYSQAAMRGGAGGTTLIPLELHFYAGKSEDHSASHAREICDHVIPSSKQASILKEIEAAKFFERENSMIELSMVDKIVTYTGGKSTVV
ncbi:MAG: hypothetical protein LBS86_08055 [Treponema sp.]|nr:hypothetical protein [Treponema sp.]